jgi:hypothetical protein
MPTLTSRHLPATTLPAFQLLRAPDGKATSPRELPPADTFPVSGRPTGLLAELRWYLEDFLEYPFSPGTERAERVLAALDAWARAPPSPRCSTSATPAPCSPPTRACAPTRGTATSCVSWSSAPPRRPW